MNYYISEGDHKPVVQFFLELLKHRICGELKEVHSPEKASAIWDSLHSKSEPIALSFYSKLSSLQGLSWKEVFKSECEIQNDRGQIDYAATCFYMVNCLQEYLPDESELDHFGRFKFNCSYQFNYENIEIDLVGELLDNFIREKGLVNASKNSRIFISHDIDTIRGALLQDGNWLFRNARFADLFKLVFTELFKRPTWNNIDQIWKVQDEYDLKSTFFWLTAKGKDTYGISQADYSPSEVKIWQDQIEESEPFDNGLHKSTLTTSFSDELEKSSIKFRTNRYHFLKFNPYPDWSKLSKSKIELDASLGFSEHFGFRNSYGNVFRPYDFIDHQYYDFIEVPLHVMDMTFKNYMKISSFESGKVIIDFLEANKKNSLISLLWHNTFFSEYKFGEYLQAYREVAAYLYESDYSSVNATEILEGYE
ncbi:MAG: hypothetical protein MK086_13365 [Flavobacteriales bacterium]|nr:hypothetical protein [Flavobacteriales bacterium]